MPVVSQISLAEVVQGLHGQLLVAFPVVFEEGLFLVQDFNLYACVTMYSWNLTIFREWESFLPFTDGTGDK